VAQELQGMCAACSSLLLLLQSTAASMCIPEFLWASHHCLYFPLQATASILLQVLIAYTNPAEQAY
jgi:hypothetical protein